MNGQNFLIEAGYRLIGPDAKNAIPHRDNAVEILQIWSDGGFFISKNSVFPLKAGMLLLVDASNYHYSVPQNQQTYNRSKVILSSEYFYALLQLCGIEKLSALHFSAGGHAFPLSPTGTTAGKIDQIFKDISHIDPTGDSSRLHITSLLIQLLVLVIDRPTTESNTENMSTADLMVQYVSKHLNVTNNIRMTDIAAALHISHSRAAHVFKSLYGKTLTQYTNELRMAEAQNLLLTTKLKIKDISNVLHFQSSTIFCKYFKQYTGCTPRQYRESGGLIVPSV